MQVDVESVVVDINGIRIVSSGVLHAAAGTIVGLVGPNGSGKSTLLRTIYRALRPMEGIIQVGGDPVWGMSARQAARRTAVLTQESPTDFDFTVSESWHWVGCRTKTCCNAPTSPTSKSSTTRSPAPEHPT